jgi:hypothetical protein
MLVVKFINGSFKLQNNLGMFIHKTVYTNYNHITYINIMLSVCLYGLPCLPFNV